MPINNNMNKELYMRVNNDSFLSVPFYISLQYEPQKSFTLFDKLYKLCYNACEPDIAENFS